MRKCCLLSLSVVLTLLISVGCSSNSSNAIPPAIELSEFLPTTNENYLGDSGYYHAVESVEHKSTLDTESAILRGEVKDNSTTITKADFDFEIVLTVDAEQMVQTYMGTRLNESNFSNLILLKRPLEVGNTWTFKAKDIAGNKWKVTGEITAIDETGNLISVKHSTKDGYYEERVLQKGRGVIEFLRLLIFKNESMSTGYHVEKPSTTMTESEVLPDDALKIPIAYYNLLLGFEQAWSDYVKQENEDLMQFISVESPAYEKIKAVSRDANTAIEFVRFYPYDMRDDDSMLTIKIVEIFKTNEDVTIENKVLYRIVIEKGVAKIYDFETIK